MEDWEINRELPPSHQTCERFQVTGTGGATNEAQVGVLRMITNGHYLYTCVDGKAERSWARLARLMRPLTGEEVVALAELMQGNVLAFDKRWSAVYETAETLVKMRVAKGFRLFSGKVGKYWTRDGYLTDGVFPEQWEAAVRLAELGEIEKSWEDDVVTWQDLGDEVLAMLQSGAHFIEKAPDEYWWQLQGQEVREMTRDERMVMHRLAFEMKLGEVSPFQAYLITRDAERENEERKVMAILDDGVTVHVGTNGRWWARGGRTTAPIDDTQWRALERLVRRGAVRNTWEAPVQKSLF
jgi:hypothetical protein